MPEKLPSTASGREESYDKQWTPESGIRRVDHIEAESKADGETLLAQYIQTARGFDNDITELSLRTRRGRATLDITRANPADGFLGSGADPETEGIQELYSVRVIRPIYMAPYFLGSSPEDTRRIAEVRTAFDAGETEPGSGWDLIQKQLFGHLVTGYDTYPETAYEFRRSYRTNSGTVASVATQNINTVDIVNPLPELSNRLQNLIDGLPDGEWMKQAGQVLFMGREGWDVSESWLWNPKWSVAVGGTFTGGY